MEDTDWLSLPKECSRIQIQKQLASHSEATLFCESSGAHLMKIDERWKMDFVVELLQACEGLREEEYWVDGTNMNATNFNAPDAWRFYDGSLVPMDKYFWASHAPNSAETQHCFRIVDKLWDDMHCDFQYWFICEK
ncbi:snaclec alboaggregin-A subunit alpha-like [Mercenaria mercenaria]|uniref:snaclec alboaggregin-A subunit alpha-like n=1 Tax=Mercenaria mercenaria TaxID=6596 RepID=UPI00234FAF31|nr:snaclec alboaggregin-A subunit alpha-like [Mercenaria mercenaria]